MIHGLSSDIDAARFKAMACYTSFSSILKLCRKIFLTILIFGIMKIMDLQCLLYHKEKESISIAYIDNKHFFAMFEYHDVLLLLIKYNVKMQSIFIVKKTLYFAKVKILKKTLFY